MQILESFEEIKIETPVEKIIKQIRGLIVSGYLQPGDKLPSERKLAEKLGVGRTYIREAIKKLEFLGILQTLPQSGVVINGVDISMMEGLLSNVYSIEEPDFRSLVEMRVVLEKYAIQKAAEIATEDDLRKIEQTIFDFEEKLKVGLPTDKDDFKFHVSIIEASKNKVAKSMMLIILPDILNIYNKKSVCSTERRAKALVEHKNIFEAIKAHEGDKAVALLEEHLVDVIASTK